MMNMKFPWPNFFRNKSDIKDQVNPISVGESPGGEGSLNEFSATWLFIKNHAESEIERLRKKNDAVSLGIEQTAAIRGEIKALRDLIALPKAGQRKAGLMRSSHSEDNSDRN